MLVLTWWARQWWAHCNGFWAVRWNPTEASQLEVDRLVVALYMVPALADSAAACRRRHASNIITAIAARQEYCPVLQCRQAELLY